jgi:glycosyltransferase involved in cell wall biosynthesis
VAKIALIQTYPYDAVAGGDGAYIQSFGQYLHQLGHEIHGLVTDTTRERTSPIYESFYRVDKYHSWRVRNSVRVSRRAFLDYRLSRIPMKLLEKLGWLKRAKKTGDEAAARTEALWCSQQLEKMCPDAIILCFDAVQFASSLAHFRGKILALPGPIPGRRLRKTSTDPIPPVQARLARALAHADCVAFNSHDDLSYAVDHLNVTRAIVVGMGFPAQAILPASHEPIILFVGNDTPPNRSGILWFIEQIWPTIRTSCPDARLRIVGRVAVGNAGSQAGVDRIGPVADLVPEYKRAQVVIAPLISGTAGVKIKVAEAMSYGRPLVSTSIGVDGGDPRQLDPAAIITDDPGDFARGIISLLKDPKLRQKKSEGAAQVFENCFSYKSSYCELSKWIDEILGGTPPPPAPLSLTNRLAQLDSPDYFPIAQPRTKNDEGPN